jgi:hypothetical protein
VPEEQQPLTRQFATRYVRFRHPAGLVAAVQAYPPEAVAPVHTVVVGEPGAEAGEPPRWAGFGRRGFRLTVFPALPGSERLAIAEVIAAGELVPAGGPEGLVPRPFGGQPALWRHSVLMGEHGYFVYAAAFAHVWSVMWQRPADDATQAAMLATVELLDPAA